jgi:glycerol-3-phosphate dehydrogenase (NAD(P)+)
MAGAKSIAEGVRTSRSIHELSRKVSVEMPICNEVYYVCHENKDPKAAAHDLMTRRLKDEF